MTLRSDILAVARELGEGTHEDVVVRCFERWPERFGFTPSRRLPDSNVVYPRLSVLIARGLLVHTGPHRWRVPGFHRTPRINLAAPNLVVQTIRERDAIVAAPAPEPPPRPVGRPTHAVLVNGVEGGRYSDPVSAQRAADRLPYSVRSVRVVRIADGAVIAQRGAWSGMDAARFARIAARGEAAE